jgi:ADP-ribose diphosphatase
MREKPTILNRQTIARTRIFHVEQLELRFANGVETQYERLLGSPQGSVLIVPLLDDNTVLLIREYAAGIDRYELALPKGRIEKGEELLPAANREIMEEVGYAANDLHHLTSLSVAPGYVGYFTHVVLARDLYPCTAEGDEPEPIDVVPWKLDQLPQLLQRDDCSEARSIAALYMTREYLANV